MHCVFSKLSSKGVRVLSTCTKHINSRTFVGKHDPSSFFDDMGSNWVRFNRMSPDKLMSTKVTSSIAACTIKDNPVYNIFLMLQRDLKDVDCHELEKRIMYYYHDHIHHLEDHEKLGPKILMATSISDALDSELAVGISHHPCPFSTSGYVYHRCRDCPVLAETIRCRYAYQNGKVDPKWNPDN